jgi:hypothetical protein
MRAAAAHRRLPKQPRVRPIPEYDKDAGPQERAGTITNSDDQSALAMISA